MSTEQVVLITGSTDGLGRATAHALAARGSTVLLHGRDRARGEAVRREIRDATGNDRLRYYQADFSSLAAVRQLAAEVLADQQRLDLVINNAGIGAGAPGSGRDESQDGYELRFTVNYLAPFLLTHLLLPLLRDTRPARIINVASVGQAAIDFDDVMLARRYDGWGAYRQSKLAQIMFTFELAERLRARGERSVTVNALHPASLMPTKMVFEALVDTMSRLEDGVSAVLHLATAPELSRVSGQYFDGQRESRAHPQAYDANARRRLWELSERLCGLSVASGNTP